MRAISWLHDLVANFVCLVKTALIDVINLLVTGVGDAWTYVVGLLPAMPAQPDLPSYIDQAVWLMYQLVDVGWLVAYVVSYFVMLGVLFGVMILLRLIRAVD